MNSVVLDTHVLHWWSSEPGRVSKRATTAIGAADELLVAGISWFELAWLARNGRISVTTPIRSWLEGLGWSVRTIGISPAIAETAVSLPPSFPGDPADRLIYATAIEFGRPLVSKDRRIRDQAGSGPTVIW